MQTGRPFGRPAAHRRARDYGVVVVVVVDSVVVVEPGAVESAGAIVLSVGAIAVSGAIVESVVVSVVVVSVVDVVLGPHAATPNAAAAAKSAAKPRLRFVMSDYLSSRNHRRSPDMAFAPQRQEERAD
jgi:hypothetical protein